MMAYLIIIHQTKHYLKVLTVAVFIVFILWIGASRIYLGVHWMSDVLGGYVIGSLFLALEIWLYLRWSPKTGQVAKVGFCS
jgi:undecaprenyl-diphosphatase